MTIRINGGAFVDTDAEALAYVRRLVLQLSPSWRDPERYHLAKSEILGALATLHRIAARQPSPIHPPRQAPPRSPPAGAAAARVIAARVFAPPVQPPPEPRHEAVQALPIKRPRRGRKHRYPQPPKGLVHQGVLL
jgi:hypothetical protein